MDDYWYYWHTYSWGNSQRPLFILSIRVWPSAVLRIKSNYHHRHQYLTDAGVARSLNGGVGLGDEVLENNFELMITGFYS
jgi:hypothetical protein